MITRQVDVIQDFPELPTRWLLPGPAYPVLRKMFSLTEPARRARQLTNNSTGDTATKTAQTCPSDTPPESFDDLAERFERLLRVRKGIRFTLEIWLRDCEIKDELWELCDLDHLNRQAELEESEKPMTEIDDWNEWVHDEWWGNADDLDELSEAANPVDVATLPKRLVDASFLANRQGALDKGRPECAICMDDFVVDESVTTLPCNQFFHTTCVESWLLDQSELCPYCRQVVRPLGTGDLSV